MNVIKDFKEFAMRGNVIDMAVGIIIGGAFGTIVKSLVDDLLMPPIGLLLGGIDFSNFFLVLKSGAKAAGPYAALAEAKAAGAVTVNYGVFLNVMVSFMIVAFAVFMLIRTINMARRGDAPPAPQPATRECPYCMSTIALSATRCPNCTSQIEPIAAAVQ